MAQIVPELLPPREPRKRVVLLHRSGLHRIVGEFDPSVHTLRDFVEFSVITDGVVEPIAASLIQVQPRFVLYRQITAPPATGRLDEFHPQQR